MYMRKFFIFCSLLICSFYLLGQRVVGYVPYYGNQSRIQYDKVTDLIFGFAELYEDGSITLPSSFFTIATQANKHNVNLYLSVGGGGTSEIFSPVVKDSLARKRLAKELDSLIQKYDLAGIDLDWEFPSSSEANNFTKLLKEIKTTIGEKELSVAVGAINFGSSAYTLASDKYIDFYNLMAYDNDFENNHSSLVFAQQSIRYWTEYKKVSPSKLRLGIPFYGRTTDGKAATYSSISSSNPSEAYQTDFYNNYHYNGKKTVQSKCDYVLQQGLDGVMIWEFTQDRTDEYSLLKAIDEKMKNGVICTEQPTITIENESLCNVDSTKLEVSVAHPDFEYQWKRNGQEIVAANQQLYYPNQEGNYCVNLIHTLQQCTTKTACAKVHNVTKVDIQNTIQCDVEDITLNINQAGTYHWYEGDTTQNIIFTGTSLPVQTDSFKTYYIEKLAHSATVGKRMRDLPIGRDKAGDVLDYQKANNIVFSALTDLVIDSISIYYSISQVKDTFIVSVYNQSGDLVESSQPFIPALNGKQRIPVNIFVPAGENYQLVVNGGRIWIEKKQWGVSTGFPYLQEDLILLKGVQHQDIINLIKHWYPAICDWKVYADASCRRTPVTATIKQNCEIPQIIFNQPMTSLYIDTFQVIDLEVTVTDEDGEIRLVEFVIEKDGEFYQNISANQNENIYTASFVPTITGDYTIIAKAVDNDHNEVMEESTASVFATIEQQTAITDLSEYNVQVYPNPFSTILTVDLGNLLEATISLYSGHGQLILMLENVQEEIVIDEELLSGIYFLKITTDDQNGSIKVVKY